MLECILKTWFGVFCSRQIPWSQTVLSYILVSTELHLYTLQINSLLKKNTLEECRVYKKLHSNCITNQEILFFHMMPFDKLHFYIEDVQFWLGIYNDVPADFSNPMIPLGIYIQVSMVR